MRSVEWIWQWRIARGALNLLAGLPDMGKGLLWSDIVARVSKGEDWPAGEGKAPLGNIIIFTAEDNSETTVVPRLAAAGADLDRIEIVEMARNPDDTERMFNLATDLPALKAKIEEIGNVVLVIIDPVSAYLGVGKVSSGSSTDVRGVLSPLTKLAEEKRVAILAVAHFNKKSDVTNAVLRVSDSLAWVAASRSTYIALEEPGNEGAYLFVRAKNNLAPANVTALRYMIGVRKVGHDPDIKQAINAPHVLWDNDPVKITAAEAMEAAARGSRSDEMKEAMDFLQSRLVLGPILETEIKEEARAHDISSGTLKRAKKKLKITSVKEKGKTNGKWSWKLPTHTRGE